AENAIFAGTEQPTFDNHRFRNELRLHVPLWIGLGMQGSGAEAAAATRLARAATSSTATPTHARAAAATLAVAGLIRAAHFYAVLIEATQAAVTRRARRAASLV